MVPRRTERAKMRKKRILFEGALSEFWCPGCVLRAEKFWCRHCTSLFFYDLLSRSNGKGTGNVRNAKEGISRSRCGRPELEVYCTHIMW